VARIIKARERDMTKELDTLLIDRTRDEAEAYDREKRFCGW
jgi:hypothetical protein